MSMHFTTRTITFLAAICVSAGAMTGDSLSPTGIIHVPNDYPTIQEAVDAAQDGDTILVALGVYEEAIVVEAKAITLRSERGADVTTLQNPGDGTTTLHCIDIGHGTFTVEGFTFAGAAPAAGRGMRAEQSHIEIRNCRFVDYATTSPGGSAIWAMDGVLHVESSHINGNVCTLNSPLLATNTAVHIEKCQVTNNEGRSGAIRLFDPGQTTITHCIFDSNVATPPVNVVGGGALGVTYWHKPLTNAPLLIESCTFTNNVASVKHPPDALTAGGALVLSFQNESAGHIQATVSDSTFVGNSAHSGGAVWIGGEVAQSGGNMTPVLFEHCKFIGNASTVKHGSAMSIQKNQLSVTLNEVLFADNDAAEIATLIVGAVYNDVEVNVINCEFVANTGTGISAIGAYALERSGTRLNVTGTLFAENVAGSNGFLLRTHELAHTTLTNSIFCANDPQIFDGVLTDGGGNLFGPHCPIGDLTGDGTVGGADLGQLLAAWGDCEECDEPTADCPPDFNADCIVDGADLGILLANWG